MRIPLVGLHATYIASVLVSFCAFVPLFVMVKAFVPFETTNSSKRIRFTYLVLSDLRRENLHLRMGFGPLAIGSIRHNFVFDIPSDLGCV